MRVRSGYDLLDLVLEHSDNIYPSTSPTPAPKLTVCTRPTELCQHLQYSIDGICTAPASLSDECQCATVNKRVGHVAQRTEFGHPSLPRGCRFFRGGLRGNRAERRREAIRTWTLTELYCLCADGELSHPARIILYDLDEPMSMQQYDSLADRLWEDFNTRRTAVRVRQVREGV